MFSPRSHVLFEIKLLVCLSVCLQMWFYKSFTTNANLLWLWESPMLVRCNAEWVPFIQSEAIEAATVGWRASPRPVPCFLLVPYLNLPYPTLLCVNSYTLMRTPSSLQPWCYGTLRLSLGCFRFEGQCVLPSSAFLRACPTLPILFLPFLSAFTVLHLLWLNPCPLFILLLPLLPALILLPVLPIFIEGRRKI